MRIIREVSERKTVITGKRERTWVTKQTKNNVWEAVPDRGSDEYNFHTLVKEIAGVRQEMLRTCEPATVVDWNKALSIT